MKLSFNKLCPIEKIKWNFFEKFIDPPILQAVTNLLPSASAEW